MATLLPTPPRTQLLYTHPESEEGENENASTDDEEIGPEQPLREPFDITEQPESMEAMNPPIQSLALRAAILDTQENTANHFEQQPVSQRMLNTLARSYHDISTREHVSKMSHRTKINWRTSDHVVPSDNRDLHWKSDEYYIDLLICRGRDIGIAAIIPNVEIHHAIEFKLEMDWSPRSFSTKYAHLGFDPTGAMQYVGRTHRGEDAWIAWIPQEATGDDLDEYEAIAPGTCAGDSRISRRHHQGAFMYFAWQLHKMGYRDIVVYEKYPDLDDQYDVDAATNLR